MCGYDLFRTILFRGLIWDTQTGIIIYLLFVRKAIFREKRVKKEVFLCEFFVVVVQSV